MKKRALPWLVEMGMEWSRFARLRADAAPPAPPPLPPIEARLRTLQAKGYGTTARPFYKGLQAQGMPRSTAEAAVADAVRRKILVLTHQGWVVA